MSLLRVTLLLYAFGLGGIAFVILSRHSDSVWLVALLYVATGAFLVAALITIFAISKIGDSKR